LSLNGVSSANFSPGSTITLNNVNINGSGGTVTLLTALNMGGGTLSIFPSVGAGFTANGFAITAQSLFHSNGTFTAGAATHNFSGTLSFTGGSFLSGTGTFNLNGSAQSIFGGPAFNSLKHSSPALATLTFESGKTCSVAG